MIGTVKIINKDKGFGFVSVEELGKDLFFHATKVKGGVFEDLEIGTVVGIDGVAENVKGQYADGITMQ